MANVEYYDGVQIIYDDDDSSIQYFNGMLYGNGSPLCEQYDDNDWCCFQNVVQTTSLSDDQDVFIHRLMRLRQFRIWPRLLHVFATVVSRSTINDEMPSWNLIHIQDVDTVKAIMPELFNDHNESTSPTSPSTVELEEITDHIQSSYASEYISDEDLLKHI